MTKDLFLQSIVNNIHMDEVTQPLPFLAWEQIQKEVVSDLKREKTVFVKRDMGVYMIDLSTEISVNRF